MNVVILDTGCANLNSVKSAVARHGGGGWTPRLTDFFRPAARAGGRDDARL